MTPRRRFSSRLSAAVPLALAALLAVAGPAGAQSASSVSPAAAAALGCDQCGKVESIRQSTSRQQWTPLGTGVGVGGAPSLGETPSAVTSFKIGPGGSNQGMVVLGAAGGAAYRRTPESYEQQRWDVTVRLSSGAVRVVSLPYEPYVHEGDWVRIAGSNVELLDQ
jgi:hypothetical protein